MNECQSFICLVQTRYFSNNSRKLSFFAWNINGLSSKTFGDKLQNYDYLNMINNFDFIILSETWKKSNVQIVGCKTVVTNTTKTGNHGRNSGGLALIYKSKFDDWISIQKSSPNFLWFKIKNQCSKTEKDLYACGTYIPPQNSCYFLTDLFGELENDVERFCSLGSILNMGDFNGRTGK